MSLLRRLFSKIAVVACDSCEGASGAQYDVAAGTVSICPACHGSGEAFDSPPARPSLLRRHRARTDPAERRAA